MHLKSYMPTMSEIEFREFSYQFTIFVPIYNAAKTIHRVFESLNSQTFTDFEVIFINDASKDNSNEIVNNFLKDVKYHYQYINNTVNKHKMGIFFEAISIADGEFFLVLDADDKCVPNALEIFLKEYRDVPDEIKLKLSGITGNCLDQNGQLVGTNFPENPFYSNTFNKSVYFNVEGEKWGFIKTSFLKSIRVNPEIFSKGLIPEGYIWLIFSKNNYITKYIHESLRIYYVNSEDNLSSLKYKDKAFGMVIYAITFINFFHHKHLTKKPLTFLKRLYSLIKASNYLDYKFKTYLNSIDNYTLKAIFILFWPFRKFIK